VGVPRFQTIWLGGGGRPSCCANPAIFKKVTYDDATDTWSVAATSYMGSGHSYDGNALDPVTGYHYFGKFEDNYVKRWNGLTWGMLPALPFSGGTTPSLAWFPDINNGAGGLVYLGSDGNLAWYNGTSWTRITGAMLSSYNGFAEYSPAHKVVWLGGGNGTDRVSYKLSAGLVLTKLKDAPFSISNSCALHSCDPVSGKYIVTNQANETWWEFDISTDTWTQLTSLTSKPSFGTACDGNGNNQFQVPISDYGVIMYFSDANARNVYLYRHTLGSAAERIRTAPQGITVSPNPFRCSVTIRAPFQAALKIFDIRGRTVASFEGKDEIRWNAEGLPSGVYLLQMNSRDRVAAEKLLLNR